MDTPRKALTGTVLSDLFGNTWPQKASQLPYTTFLETRLPPLRPSTPLPQDSWCRSQPSIRPAVSSPRRSQLRATVAAFQKEAGSSGPLRYSGLVPVTQACTLTQDSPGAACQGPSLHSCLNNGFIAYFPLSLVFFSIRLISLERERPCGLRRNEREQKRVALGGGSASGHFMPWEGKPVRGRDRDVRPLIFSRCSASRPGLHGLTACPM